MHRKIYKSILFKKSNNINELTKFFMNDFDEKKKLVNQLGRNLLECSLI